MEKTKDKWFEAEVHRVFVVAREGRKRAVRVASRERSC
jgi:hypothetical protein